MQTKIAGSVIIFLTLAVMTWIGNSVLNLNAGQVAFGAELRALKELTDYRLAAIEREMREGQTRRENQIKDLKDQIDKLTAAVRER